MKTWQWVVVAAIVVWVLMQRGLLGGAMARTTTGVRPPSTTGGGPSTIDRIGSGLGKIFDEAGPAIGKFVGGLFGSGGGGASAAGGGYGDYVDEFN